MNISGLPSDGKDWARIRIKDLTFLQHKTTYPGFGFQKPVDAAVRNLIIFRRARREASLTIPMDEAIGEEFSGTGTVVDTLHGRDVLSA
jgi:hypothetical protein